MRELPRNRRQYLRVNDVLDMSVEQPDHELLIQKHFTGGKMNCPFKENCLVFQHILNNVNNLEQIKKENEALKKEVLWLKGKAVEQNSDYQPTEVTGEPDC